MNRCIVRDRNGNAWGPFEKTNEPGEWARRKWPDQQQDERRIGVGWEMALRRLPIPMGLLAAVRDGDLRPAEAARQAGVSRQAFDNRLRTFKVEQARQRSRRAIETCGKWLAACLKSGWPKSDLDDLEQLWWRWHDENGNLLSAPRHCYR